MNDDAAAGNQPTDEKRWLQTAGRALRASEAHLDAATAARLRAARAKAVTALARRSSHWIFAAPAAVAAALLVWTLLPTALMAPPDDPVNRDGPDALEVLTDEQGPEFYQQLDLYMWLEGTSESADSA